MKSRCYIKKSKFSGFVMLITVHLNSVRRSLLSSSDLTLCILVYVYRCFEVNNCSASRYKGKPTAVKDDRHYSIPQSSWFPHDIRAHIPSQSCSSAMNNQAIRYSEASQSIYQTRHQTLLSKVISMRTSNFVYV